MTFEEFRDEARRLLHEENPDDDVAVKRVDWWMSHYPNANERASTEYKIWSAKFDRHFCGASMDEALRDLKEFLVPIKAMGLLP